MNDGVDGESLEIGNRVIFRNGGVDSINRVILLQLDKIKGGVDIVGIEWNKGNTEWSEYQIRVDIR